MKALILSIAVGVLLTAGCTTKKAVLKSHSKAQDERSVQSDTKTTTTDKTVTTITAVTDTVITTPGIKLASESAGVSTVVQTDDGTLSATYDPVLNIIKQSFVSAPKQQTIQKKQVTVVQDDVKQEVVAKVDSTRKTTTVQTNMQKDVKRSYVLFGLGGLLILCGIGYLIYRKLRK